MQKPKNYGALKAKRNGESFEQLIEITCAYYSKMGIAHIQKTPEPMRVIKPIGGGRYTAVFTKKAQPDFTGTLKGGKSIVFEAKHTDGTNIPFDRINKEQERDLALHNHLDAFTGIIISFGMKHFYFIPYDLWVYKKENIGKKSVNQLDLVDYEISTKKGIVDFLEGVNR